MNKTKWMKLCTKMNKSEGSMSIWYKTKTYWYLLCFPVKDRSYKKVWYVWIDGNGADYVYFTKIYFAIK